MVTKVTNDVLADNAVSTNNIANLAITGDKIAAGAITGTAIANNSIDGTKIALGSDAQGDIMYYNGTDWARLAAGTSGDYLKTQGAGADPAWAAVTTPLFTKSFTSSQQTITAAALLTLPHSLATTPLFMRFSLVCTVIDNDWAVNDVIEVAPGVTTSAGNASFAAYSDATNIYIRFGSLATNTIVYMNKTTGASVLLLNTSWRMVVRAWA